MSPELKPIGEVFMTMERLAAMCATPGIEEDTKKIMNEQLRDLLNGVVKKYITDLKAASNGLIV